jgi:hypothetical protein
MTETGITGSAGGETEKLPPFFFMEGVLFLNYLISARNCPTAAVTSSRWL